MSKAVVKCLHKCFVYFSLVLPLAMFSLRLHVGTPMTATQTGQFLEFLEASKYVVLQKKLDVTYVKTNMP